MSDEQQVPTVEEKNNAKFSSREHGVIWIVGSALLTAGVAWGAYLLQQRGMAPVVIFPLLVGATLGAGQIGLARLTGFASGKVQLAAAVVWGLLVVIGQDYIGYRDDLKRHDEQMVAREKAVAAGFLKPDDPRLTPPSFGSSIVKRIEMQPVMWSLDLVLTVVASTAVVWLNRIPRKDAESLAKN